MIPINGFDVRELEYDSSVRQYNTSIEHLINLANGNPFLVINGLPALRINVNGQPRDFIYETSHYGSCDERLSADYRNGTQTIRVRAHSG